MYQHTYGGLKNVKLNTTTRLPGINSIRAGMAKNIKMYKNQTKHHHVIDERKHVEDGVGD